MRLIAALSVLILFGFAVYLAALVRRHQPAPTPIQPTPPASIQTNAPDGFFVGEGDQRSYVQYATPDPVLRSFMQTVMDGSSDPTTKGREIFQKICAACHQKDGEGKDGLAPPLVGSEWVLAPRGDRLVRIVINGLSGPIQVRGKTWNLAMPPLKENLGDDQIAVVLSYVRSRLAGNHAGLITSEAAAAARKEARATPESSETLLRVSDE
jgi:mono/diheme cytochrome c family protein